MPVIYENEGHRRRMIKESFRFVWKLREWRKDPTCRKCKRDTHMRHWDQSALRSLATVDHKLAQALGGEDVENNFELLCYKCNNRKSRVEAKVADILKKAAKKIS